MPGSPPPARGKEGDDAVLSFGVTFMLDPPVSRTIEWAKLAEAQGFDAVWAWDSHVLWQEFYTTFALVAANTERVRLGPCVTNPATRDVDGDRQRHGHPAGGLGRADGHRDGTRG